MGHYLQTDHFYFDLMLKVFQKIWMQLKRLFILEEEMVTHSSILVWRTMCTEEPWAR